MGKWRNWKNKWQRIIEESDTKAGKERCSRCMNEKIRPQANYCDVCGERI